MNKVIIGLGVGLATALGVRAEAFPDADGSHDFSSPVAWGLDALPEAASFENDEAATYTASSDATFSTLSLLNGSRTFDLSATPNRTVTLTGDGNAFVVDKASTNELKGGTWRFANDGNVLRFASGSAQNSRLVLSDGCVVTNAGNVIVSESISGSNSLVICEGAALYSHSEGRIGRWQSGATGADGSALEVLSGGRFVSSGMFWVYNGESRTPARSEVSLHVSGDGSLFEVTDTASGFFMGGKNLSGDTVMVDDGATLRLGGRLSLGYWEGAGDLRVTVDDANLEARRIHVGDRSLMHDMPNVLEILNGATVTLSEHMVVGNSGDNSICILSNATLNCQRFYVGEALTAASNRFTVRGADAKINVGYTGTYGLFSAGHDNRIELTDGASWRYDSAALYTCIMGPGSNNVISISDGAALRSTEKLFIGYREDEYGNRVEVENGGELEAAEILLQRNGQELLVSNGTVTCTSTRVKICGNGSRLTLCGPDAVCRQEKVVAKGNTYQLFEDTARNCSMDVLDGAIWAYDANGVYTGINPAGTHSNTLNVARGGTFRAGALFHVGYTSDSGNAVNVFDGGILDVGNLRVASKGQTVTVSNGVVRCGGDIVIGYVQGNIESVDDRFIVAGTNSSVTVGGSLRTNASAVSPTLEFNVPKDGYVQVPVTAKRIEITENAVLDIDADAFQSSLAHAARVMLAEAADVCSVDAAVLAAANERLMAQRMSVSVVNGKRLVLRARPQRTGFAICVR